MISAFLYDNEVGTKHMSDPSSQPNAFYIEDFDLSKISELERLIIQQAQHHKCDYTGKTEALVAALTAPNPVPEIYFVMSADDPQRALAYGLYCSAWTADGHVAYMEDLCTDISYRNGRGIGRFGFAEMCSRTEAEGGYAVVGSVMGNNTGTIEFWKKNAAVVVPKNSYDLTNLFNDRSGVAGANDFTAERITGPNAVVPQVAQGALSAPNTGVFVVSDASGDPAALVFANANFSSFRNVSGVIMEPVKFLKPLSDQEQRDVLRAGVNAVCDFAQASGFTGHLYAGAKSDYAVSNDYLNSVGTGRLQMNADPASAFINMAVYLPLWQQPAPAPAPAPRPA